MSWQQRLGTLNDIHDYLTDEFASIEELCDVFPSLVAAMIDRLGILDIECAEQAHIYANSINPEHRAKAGAWLARHQGPGAQFAVA